MSQLQAFRWLVQQRLGAAAEDILGLFEGTIAEYEQQPGPSREENQQRRRTGWFSPGGPGSLRSPPPRSAGEPRLGRSVDATMRG